MSRPTPLALMCAAGAALAVLSTVAVVATAFPIRAGSIPDPVIRDHLSHGTAGCQSALPVFDGNIRKRPLAVANEGASSAFLTCDFDDIDNNFGGKEKVGIYFVNQSGAADATVSCTLVDGVVISPAMTRYFPKVSPPIALGATSGILWDAVADAVESGRYIAPALSCSLPPGIAVWAVQNVYPEDIGL